MVSCSSGRPWWPAPLARSPSFLEGKFGFGGAQLDAAFCGVMTPVAAGPSPARLPSFKGKFGLGGGERLGAGDCSPNGEATGGRRQSARPLQMGSRRLRFGARPSNEKLAAVCLVRWARSTASRLASVSGPSLRVGGPQQPQPREAAAGENCSSVSACFKLQ